MRRKARTDSNQSTIVKALRGIPGVSVAVTSALGNGFVDIVVGRLGVSYLIEIKDENKPPSDRKLTPAEEKFHSEWTGQKAVCKNLDEILKTIGVLK